MPMQLSWLDIAIRIALALAFSLVIGLNRDERGNPAGMRTTMLVCFAATLAQLQANLLLGTSGKTPSSFSVLDLERLPLGILSGIGFIGAGVIIKREHNLVSGVTTAATIWFVTVLGLLFGAGQLWLGSCSALVAIAILWALKYTEGAFHREHSALVKMEFSSAPDEADLRRRLAEAGCKIKQWAPTYAPPGRITELRCEVAWSERSNREPHTPESIIQIARLESVASVTWDE